ncbi:MAG: hypothetical protein C0408_11115, partial [Odoribacter sp.]|nr:hypothetical protein [Odoribacter sp.]
GGDISRRLQAIYNYVTVRILQADLNRDFDGFDEVIGIMTELLSAWKQIITGQGKKFQPESIGFNEERTQQALRI